MSRGFQKIIDIIRGKDKNIRFKKFDKFCQKNNLCTIKNIKYFSFQKSNTPVEIIIPCIDKDSDVLPFVIDSARENILHPISSINIIAPANSEKIKKICEDKSCNLIDELSIIKHDSNIAGWLYQQFLKIEYSKFAKTDYYLILDGDTIINQPVSFIVDNKCLLEYSDEYHTDYFNFLKTLGLFNETNVSFIAHHMLINKQRMLEFIKFMEKKSDNNQSWEKVLMNLKLMKKHQEMSEYEIYSNFMIKFYPNDIIIDYYYNKGFDSKNIEEMSQIREKNKEFRTLSFHDYCYSQKYLDKINKKKK